MKRSDLKLISARIDEESYNMISDIADRHPYWTKNYVIRKILFAVLNDFDDRAIYDMLRRPYRPICPPKCEYHYPYLGNNSKE